MGTGHAHGTGSVNLRGMSSSLHDVGHFGIGGEVCVAPETLVISPDGLADGWGCRWPTCSTL